MSEPKGAECQCVACDRIFGGERGFQTHQYWGPGGLLCLNPAALGMTIRTRKDHQVWVMPYPEPEGAKATRRKVIKAALVESLRPETDVKVGDSVRLHRKKFPKRGTWPRYEGKTGVVTALNLEDGEIQVRVSEANEAWFRRDEYELVAV